MNLNKAMVIGNLVRDPEVKTTPSGQSVASFSIATNFVWTDQSGQKQEKAEFHNIIAWRRLAEICGQYLKKGSKIYIEGRLQTKDWVGQDGIKRYRTEIVAENMIMLDSKGGSGGGNFQNQSQNQGQSPSQAAPAEPVINIDEEPKEDEIQVENIPF